MTDRVRTEAGRLARLGFVDRDRATRLLSSRRLEPLLTASGVDVLAELGGSADPDAALLGLVDVLEAADEHEWRRIVDATVADEGVRRRLVDILGTSPALGRFLARHPDRWTVLADGQSLARWPGARATRVRLLTAVGADPDDPAPTASRSDDAVLDALRVAYRTAVLEVAVRDVSGLATMDEVAGWLSDVADAVLDAGLAIARAQVGVRALGCRLAVVAMGKCGGRELNYVSDVDVVFVGSPDGSAGDDEALAVATALATATMRACTARTGEGTIWEVDAALRPEGRRGALVRTLDSHVAYYQRWAATWEFQALLKARAAAGDLALGAQYVDAVRPFVWHAADRPDFVEDVQRMRRRVEEHVPAKVGARELKLAPGGLRDVEFAVQLLQLVHGRSDETLRSATTLAALEALADGGYVGREDAATLAAAYRFLRTLEHRLQLRRLERTHTMPQAEPDLRRLGRAVGFRSDPVAELDAAWTAHARQVRRLHEKLFYRPLLHAVARLDAGEARLSPQAAQQRLEALGYVDPAGALRHLEALSAGVSRRAAIQRTLLPVLLGWFADAPDPDGGLLGFRRVSEALGTTPWYLRLLRDESVVAERLARVLATSRYATDLLLQGPEAVGILAEDVDRPPQATIGLVTEVRSVVDRYDDPAAAVAAIRSIRRRELLRIASTQVVGAATPEAVGGALSDVATATVDGALQAVRRIVDPTGLVDFAVISMGRFGGRELGFGSDVDVMFVHRSRGGTADEQAAVVARRIAEEFRRLLMAPSGDPPLDIDADLRPEGRHGPLVRSLASYAAYYARWSAPWEAQALLRAQVVAGDEDLGRAFQELIDPLRWPTVIGVDAVREVRRLKARMEAERLPRGVDPTLHTKLGRGGLSDVEWVAQLLQLQHAHAVPGLRTTQTLPALRAAADAGLLSAADATLLADAWRAATSMRNAITLVRGRPGDQVPTDVRDLRAVAFVLGYPMDQAGRLVEDYRRTTRRARTVTERVFYGEVGEVD